MKSATKKKIVNVNPISGIAKHKFIDIMDSLHACRIQDETDDKLLLLSLNQKYLFWIQKSGNKHWEIVK